MKAVYIPSGPKNLAVVFPDINFRDVSEYSIELYSGATKLLTSNIFLIEGCKEDQVRIHFVNALGAIDAINFTLVTIEHETKSDTIERPTSYPLDRPAHAVARNNVKANDTLLLRTIAYEEKYMRWIKELFDSPLHWMEQQGLQGEPDSYIPLVVVDQKVMEVKEDDRFINEVSLQVKLSHERFNIRN